MYLFDGTVFHGNMSTELAIRCILRISGVSVDGKSDIGRYWTPSATGKVSIERTSATPADIMVSEPTYDSELDRILSNRVSQDLEKNLLAHRKEMMTKRSAQIDKQFREWKKSKNNKQLTLDDMWKDEIEKKKSKFASYSLGSTFVCVLEDTLKKPGPIMRFSVYTVAIKLGVLRVLIDPEIFEGVMSNELLAVLLGVMKDNLAFSKTLENFRPTWMDELHDIDLALNGKDLDRNLNFRATNDIFRYGSYHTAAFNVEWAIKGTPKEVFYPPDWDANTVATRIQAEILAEQAKAKTRNNGGKPKKR
jgi:hypothetical protein